MDLTRESFAALDAADPLASHRDRFHLPGGVIYLDGNSLGALPKATRQRLAAVVDREWGRDLIRSWNLADWIHLPQRVGEKIAHLIGARSGEVVVADSTSVNLFKVLAAALRLTGKKPHRRVILSESENFPTDLYVAQGLVELLGGVHELKLVEADAIADAMDERTAVVMLTHVNYRTGCMHDMAGLTARAHARGAIVIWDLAHSAGAVPVDVTGSGVDFAVGCGYKYLNGGPGAPAFLYVSKRHHQHAIQPLTGWMGHSNPFAFDGRYEPAEGISRFLCGTPAVLSMTALECGVDTVLAADMGLIREKSLALTDLFIRLVEERCKGHGLLLLTPREGAGRGSQISFRHQNGYPVMQALIAHGVIGDFRAPDILRFGCAPLYLRYKDVWEAVDRLAGILDTRSWDRPDFRQQALVT